jgi:hypothetical protein
MKFLRGMVAFASHLQKHWYKYVFGTAAVLAVLGLLAVALIPGAQALVAGIAIGGFSLGFLGSMTAWGAGGAFAGVVAAGVVGVGVVLSSIKSSLGMLWGNTFGRLFGKSQQEIVVDPEKVALEQQVETLSDKLERSEQNVDSLTKDNETKSRAVQALEGTVQKLNKQLTIAEVAKEHAVENAERRVRHEYELKEAETRGKTSVVVKDSGFERNSLFRSSDKKPSNGGFLPPHILDEEVETTSLLKSSH